MHIHSFSKSFVTHSDSIHTIKPQYNLLPMYSPVFRLVVKFQFINPLYVCNRKGCCAVSFPSTDYVLKILEYTLWSCHRILNMAGNSNITLNGCVSSLPSRQKCAVKIKIGNFFPTIHFRPSEYATGKTMRLRNIRIK